MSDPRIGRRDVIRLGATAAIFGWTVAAPAAQSDGQKDDPNRLVDFAIDIPGLPNASQNIREIAFEEPTIRPRRIKLGSVTLTSAVTNGKKELKAWFDEAQSGKKRRVRKTITVTLFKSDKTPGRHYLLYDCFPTQWSSVNFDTSSTVQTETLTVKTTRVEFKT